MGYLQKFESILKYENISNRLVKITQKQPTIISKSFIKVNKENLVMNYNNLLNANFRSIFSKYIYTINQN